eukprot:6198429-Pleurochrysis_carterae.AAC.1
MMYKWGHPVATLPSDEGDNTSLHLQDERKFYESSPLSWARTNYAGFRSQSSRAPTAPYGQ